MSAAATITHEPWSRSLLELLERQHVDVKELATLAESQSALFAVSHTDRLLDLLARRQTLIDEFTASQSRLAELTGGLDQKLDSVDPINRDRIKALIAQIGERLAEVMQRDEQDQASLKASRQHVKQELASLDTARQARSAYHGAPAASNRFADQRG